MSTAMSFQGLASGIKTDQLVEAILQQEGRFVQRMQDRQDFNKRRTAAVQSVRSGLSMLSLSMASLQDKLNARSVTSTDANNAYVTATASGAAAGNFDVKVTTVATRGRISPTMVDGTPQNLAVADPSAAIFTSDKASFAVRGTDGTIKAFQLSNNSLNGLRDAINASGAGVTASVVNTGRGATPYQLVITAKETGTGTTGGVVTLAAINNEDGSSTTVNPALGITAGALGVGDTFSAPTALTGGLQSGAAEQAADAVFTVNGIELTRKSNVISDVVDGVIFTLKQGGQAGTTTLTVAQDKSVATAGMQDLISKYNTVMKTYKDAAVSTKDEDGNLVEGALSGDATIRSIMGKIRTTLTGASAGLTGSYQSLSSLGVRTLADGTLSLDTTTFQAALDKDPTAAKRLFSYTASSTNGVVSLKESTDSAPTGSITFQITEYTAGGVVKGLFNGTEVTGTNGTLSGGPLSGMTLNVTGTGSGILTLSRGAGQSARDLLSKVTAPGTGDIAVDLATIDKQNKALSTQINAGQALLDRRRKVLQAKFAQMETTIAQMKAAVGGM